MKRSTVFLVALLALVGLAWAGKGGNGNGGGGNGGGGGGGGGDPTLTGLFYVFLETPVYNQFAGGAGDPVGAFALNPDGTTAQDLGDDRLGEPSYDLHAGARVFLTTRPVYGHGALPDGSQRNALVALLEDGSTHDLTTAGDDIRVLVARWGKDDSFVSYAAIVWDGSSVASTHIFAVSIAWNATTGVPAFSETPTAAVDGTVTTTGGETRSSLDGHDWSPDASQLVYEDGTDIDVATFGATTTVVTIFDDNALDSVDKGNPRWSPASGSTQIAFVDDERSVRLVESDGTGLSTFARSGKKRYGFPMWSPDGAHLAILEFRDIKIQRQWNYTTDIFVGPADGSPSNITGDVDDRIVAYGWR